MWEGTIRPENAKTFSIAFIPEDPKRIGRWRLKFIERKSSQTKISAPLSCKIGSRKLELVEKGSTRRGCQGKKEREDPRTQRWTHSIPPGDFHPTAFSHVEFVQFDGPAIGLFAFSYSPVCASVSTTNLNITKASYPLAPFCFPFIKAWKCFCSGQLFFLPINVVEKKRNSFFYFKTTFEFFWQL